LIAHTYLPRREFGRFVRSLSGLVRRGLLKGYEYLIEDFDERGAQTISYEYFKDGTWIYNHGKHLENLRVAVEEAERIGSR